MKLGYSISTSETIEAEHADYGDCAQFQIVCPYCREAVFKGKREPAERLPTHYFSHYAAKDLEAKECEFRVAALVKQRLAAVPILEGHGQSLQQFMFAFRESILHAQDNIGVPRGLISRDVMSITARRDIEFWSAPVRTILGIGRKLQDANPWTTSTMRDHCAETLGTFPAFKDHSPFWLRRQASYYLDIISHLETPQAESNLNFTAAVAWSIVVQNLNLYTTVDIKEDDKTAAVSLGRSIIAGKNQNLLLEGYRKRHFDMYRKGYKEGATDAVSDIDRLMGADRTPPRGRSALLSSAGGSTFYDACLIPKSAALPFLRSQLAENAKQRDVIRHDMFQAQLDHDMLSATRCIYPIFMGILAAVPWHENWRFVNR